MSAVRIPLVVEVTYHENGFLEPKAVIFNDTTYEVDKVLGKRNYCPMVGCFCPTEYKVYMGGTVKKIYFEESTGKWFSVKYI